jgi:hypothetical protein
MRFDSLGVSLLPRGQVRPDPRSPKLHLIKDVTKQRRLTDYFTFVNLVSHILPALCDSCTSDLINSHGWVIYKLAPF